MKKTLLSLSVSILVGTSLLTGCASTTDGGAVNIKRKQLLTVGSAELNRDAAESYSALLKEARAQKALDVPTKDANRVKNIFNRLLPQTAAFRPDGTKFDWEIHTINSKDVNAFCMPGGKMVVFTGIINELNLTDDELAAVIGHEMAHALREHSREQISQKKAKNAAFSVASLAGSLSGKVGSSQIDTANKLTEIGLMLPFSRTMEAESDVIGLELMARAGYNPEAAATVWEKMNSLTGGSSNSLLSTHPTNTARINKIRSYVPTVQPLYEEAKGKRSGKKR